MKKYIAVLVIGFPLLFWNCSGNKEKKDRDIKSDGSVVALTEASFKEKIFNYDKNHQWKYEGTMPVIIDFYADWCAPCRQLSPLVEQVAEEYKGKITVFKVDTDKEKMLAQSLGITGLPTLLYIPAEGMPAASMGWVSKDTLVKTIERVLLKK